jgi:prephenate dehydrogenase
MFISHGLTPVATIVFARFAGLEKSTKAITIYGTGLIGGSLALALKRAFPGIRVAGVDRPEVLSRALKLKIIDIEGPQPADLIVLATPVGEILRLLGEIRSGDTLITDVGSTKVAICNQAAKQALQFIGGHPMAGQEHSGPEAANASLFEGAPFFLCPVQSTPGDAIDRMRSMIKAIGAVPHTISPEDHDQLVAQISHLPQIISSLLADQTANHNGVAGPGLRSMTRMAGSPFHVWRDIFKTSGYLPHELRSFIERLQATLNSLEQGDFDKLEELFKRGGSR